MTETCSSCRFSQKVKTHLYCRRYPPDFNKDYYCIMHRQTHDTQWCGEYQCAALAPAVEEGGE